MSEFDIREAFRSVNAKLHTMGGEIERAHERCESARKKAAVALGRADGCVLLMRRFAEAMGAIEPTLLQLRGQEELPEAERAAADRALEAYRAMVEPRLGSDGGLVPIEADAVIAAGIAADEAQFALDKAFLDEGREPSLHDALSSGYRFLMFHVGLMRVEDALTPLSEADVLCLDEVYRSAEALARGGAADAQKTFALFMLWVDCYARDQVVPRARKCPSELVVRVSHYVTAALPEDRSKRWTTQRAVREWRKISGE